MDKYGEPDSIVFNNQKPVAVDKLSEFRNPTGGQLGLYFVIAYGYLSKKFPDQAEALFENDEAAILGRTELLRALYEDVKGNKPNRIHKFFGCNPKKGGFTWAKKSGESLVAGLSEDVVPNVTIGNHGSVQTAGQVERLEEFIQTLLGDEKTTRKIYIKVDVRSSDGEGYLLDNWGHKGTLQKGDLIKLKIKSWRPAHFCVFWIDSNATTWELYPDITKDLKRDDYKTRFLMKDDGSRSLLIPSNRTLHVNTNSGVETCIVLTKPQEFERDDVNDIKIRLDVLLEDSTFCHCTEDFGDFDTKLEDEKRPMRNSGLELGATPAPCEWREGIIEQMHGFARNIWFLHVPNE